LTNLAAFQLHANHLGAAREGLDQAKQLAATTDEKMHFAEIIRLRGSLQRAEGDYGPPRLCLERTITHTRNQRARLFELNTARDLAIEALAKLRSFAEWFAATLHVAIWANACIDTVGAKPGPSDNHLARLVVNCLKVCLGYPGAALAALTERQLSVRRSDLRTGALRQLRCAGSSRS
jgi:hypothetical protein